MNKLRKGDEVIVIAGKDKGKRGVISARLDDSLLLIDGINQVKKHKKPNPMADDAGGIVLKSMPIQQSNVAIYNSLSGKPDRVGIKTTEEGDKVRIYRSSGEKIGAK